MNDPRNRITGPAEVNCPGFHFQGIDFMVPVDLITGGYLQVVEGENPLTPATPSVIIPPGWMLAMIPASVAQQLRPGLAQADAAMRNPHIVMPSGH